MVLVEAPDRRSWVLVAAARHFNATLSHEGETTVRVNAIAVGYDRWGGAEPPDGGMVARTGGHSCVFCLGVSCAARHCVVCTVWGAVCQLLTGVA